jgi:hypothetical protein
MRTYLHAAVLALASAALSGEASAMQFTQLGKISEAGLLDACNKAGGKFTNSGSTHNNQSYGCNKANCDGKGGDCGVSCDAKSNECYGYNPARTAPKGRDVFGILNPSLLGPPGTGLLESAPGSPQAPPGVGTPKPVAPAPGLR